ncbi:ribosome biogenesis GTPase Der [Dissulfurirhabdus thermomarina]|uniref:GTPase Der n=1 Tax=Dissulfurirhabdus thermomarina TaxID=1765737 RepID=A0A6N9TQ65_DISTH|nr:ribosome biogenesis GTPase Der [Dissulfurirhabdus thermomarina]NDY43188.1 ribosome biogenesis GTPase Der [Dissulfurirhabdus thermomarina]NMX24498.1 ribosome biogenesis GTPase Der [Dissulfurirhabdus thermomarina]
MDATSRLPTVSLVGRPNVGKSTLFNRLTRSRRALVDATPGVTRDTRAAAVACGGVTVRLLDTGGLTAGGDGGDVITRRTHEQTLAAVEASDLAVLVLDGSRGLSAADRELVDLLRRRGRPLLLVVNKVDGPRQEAFLPEFYELGAEVLPVSAAHRRGIGRLRDRIAKALGPPPEGEDAPASGEPAPAEATEPVRVALLGRPNAGKSSLVNRLVGAPRMIVTDVPGTTRDAVDTLLTRPGARDILLVDTAGIRRRARIRDRVEKFSVVKALEALEDADVAVVVLDAREGISEQDQRILGYVAEAGKGCVVACNKWDLVQGDPDLSRRRRTELERAARFVPYAPRLFLSARTGRRVDRLLAAVDEVAAQYEAEIPTGRLNQALQRALAARQPPMSRGRHVRLYYTTQVAARPPTFLVFANYPEAIPTSYRRFLANRFRAELGLEHTPVRLRFRERERRA